MAVKERYIVDDKGNLVEVILPIAEYRRLLEAAGEGPDPDEGRRLKPGVMEELLQMEADYAAGRLETKSWEQVKRDLGLTDV
jgi:hypothetical protein